MTKPSHLEPMDVRRELALIQDGILELLDQMVEVNSHSMNREGIQRVAEMVSTSLPSGLKFVEGSAPANVPLWVFEQTVPDRRPLMLVGHLDTVFPPGMFDSRTKEDGPYLCGPGVDDMKGGVVVVIGALQILDKMGVLPDIPLLAVFNGDEEIGSVHSGKYLGKLAREAGLGFVFESGGPKGEVVTSRRGVRRFRLEIKGPGGHAGFQKGLKSSTLIELAHQIIRIEKLNKPKDGLSVNVGTASGGTAVNVVPATAEAGLEIRFWEEKNGDATADLIMASLASPTIPELFLNLERTHARPGMPKTESTEKLFRAAAGIAKSIGQPLSEEARLGASDANILSAVGLPTLDGLGPIGEMDHSIRERIVKASLFDRIELVVHLLWNLRATRVD